MGWPLVPEDTLALVLLAAVRAAGAMLFAPVLGWRQVPAGAKFGLVVAMMLAVGPVAAVRPYGGPPVVSVAFGICCVRELLTGAVLGYGALLVVAAVQAAGALLDLEVGLAASAFFDPATNDWQSAIGRCYFVAAGMIFIALDGHHALLMAIGRSLEVLPPGGGAMSAALAQGLVDLTGRLLWSAAQLAAPGMAAAFLTDLGLGLIARGVPQMNVFIVGLPAKVGIGLLILALAAPELCHNAGVLTIELFGWLPRLLAWLGG